ncbi:hypothetical protein Tco_1547256 [Tanacetum coccineum]
MLNKENYVPWSSRLLRYAKSRSNGKLIYNSIMNGPYVRRMIPEPGDPFREVPVNETFHEQTDKEVTEKELKHVEANYQSIQTILLGLPEDIYAVKKAKLFNEWERFTSTDGESIESYYHRFSKLMNDFKRNKHFPKMIASNLTILNTYNRYGSRHVTIVHQTKDLQTADYAQLYDFLKYNQKEVNKLREERLARTHDPLALMANSNNPYNYPVFYPDQPSQSTYLQQPLPNNNYNPQPSFNQNYMQQPMINPEDISDPTTAMNMALADCIARYEFGSRETDADGWRNLVVHNAVQNLGVQNVGNQNRLIVVSGIANPNANQNGNGNVVAAPGEDSVADCSKGRSRNPTPKEEFDLMAAARDLDEIKKFNVNCILMANL